MHKVYHLSVQIAISFICIPKKRNLIEEDDPSDREVRSFSSLDIEELKCNSSDGETSENDSLAANDEEFF